MTDDARVRLVSVTLDPVTRSKCVAHGIAPDVLDSCAQNGAVHSFHGHPLLITTGEDGLIQTDDVYVGFLPPELTDPPSLRALHAAALERWPDADRVLIRDSRPGPTPCPGPFRPLLRYVSKVAERSEAPDHCDIRPLEARTHGFVLELLARATVSGYAAQGRHVPFETALRYVTGEYGEALRAGHASALVAWEDGQPVGHATWLPDHADDLWPRRYDEIVDISVLDVARRRGLGTALMRIVENQAANQGSTLLGNVVVESGTSRWQQVLARLRRTGWRPEYDILVAERSNEVTPSHAH